jgi:hypothetical protein
MANTTVEEFIQGFVDHPWTQEIDGQPTEISIRSYYQQYHEFIPRIGPRLNSYYINIQDWETGYSVNIDDESTTITIADNEGQFIKFHPIFHEKLI